MFGFMKRKQDERPRQLYAVIVETARNPVFFSDYEVEDTVDGRFEMILLHLFLLFRRFRDESAESKKFSQAVFDTFVEDMDGSLRQMGIGYQRVPKKMKMIGEAFYGRMDSYDKSLADQDEAVLTDAVFRNVFPNADDDNDTQLRASAAGLAQYIQASTKVLAQTESSKIINGAFAPADPNAYLQTAAT